MSRWRPALAALAVTAGAVALLYPAMLLASPSEERDEPPAQEVDFQLPHGAQDDLDQILADQAEPDEPGLAIAVLHRGAGLYEGFRGKANLDHSVPLENTSRFYAGSLAKQVTAAGAAVLLDEGRLSLSDRIEEHLDDWPSWAEDVRIEHLIYHTAGLPDFVELLEVLDFNLADPLTLEDYLEIIATAGELIHDPGERMSLSNSNYLVLAAVIEAVTNSSLNSFAGRELFEPLGMEQTHFHDDRRRVIPNRVISYEPRTAYAGAGGQRFSQAYINTYQAYGAGGLYTTVADWKRWDRMRTENPLRLADEYWQLLHQRGKTEDGTEVPYAFGLRHDRWNELDRLGHDARFMGFRHDYRNYPEYQVSVLVLANRDDIDASRVLEKASEIVLARELEAWMEPYIGTYTNAELEVSYELTTESGQLHLTRPNRDPEPLRYAGNRRWRLGSWTLEFSEPEARRGRSSEQAPEQQDETHPERTAPRSPHFKLSTPRVFDVTFVRVDW